MMIMLFGQWSVKIDYLDVSEIWASYYKNYEEQERYKYPESNKQLLSLILLISRIEI